MKPTAKEKLLRDCVQIQMVQTTVVDLDGLLRSANAVVNESNQTSTMCRNGKAMDRRLLLDGRQKCAAQQFKVLSLCQTAWKAEVQSVLRDISPGRQT